MGFIFEIESISRLAKARIAVLDGKLLEGSVTVGATAELIHAGKSLPIHIRGVALVIVRTGADLLSITVDLRLAAASLASVGDLILSKS